MKQTKLFSDFPGIPAKTWEEKVLADLKGADYEKKLVWKPLEGFQVNPFYRGESLDDISYLEQVPGQFPFVRSYNNDNNNWFIRQDVHIRKNNYDDVNDYALKILSKGATSLGFFFPEGFIPKKEDFNALLNKICCPAFELNFCNIHSPNEFIRLLIDTFSQQQCNLNTMSLGIDYTPLNDFQLKGKLPADLSQIIDNCSKMISEYSHITQLTTIGVHGESYSNAGSTIIQEVAFTLAQAVEYLEMLIRNDIPAEEVASNIKFNVGVSSNYFMEIAKFRAFRHLWAKILEANGLEDFDKARMNIHAITGTWDMTLYDPYVNMLRSTTKAMSAATGGITSMTVLPFNIIFEEVSEFSSRIARNQQIILQEEAYFNKVADPSAGSYYIENLTDSIIGHAWNLFLDIQDKGGFISALKKGIIQKELKETARKKKDRIASRRDTLLGTNQFPNLTEYLKMNSYFAEQVESGKDSEIEPIQISRGAIEFEKLRLETDVYSNQNNRPSVFLFTYGNVAMRRARAQFSANFFSTAGYKIIDNNGFSSVEAGIDVIKEKKPNIVVLCSSDEEYPQFAAELLSKLPEHVISVVAGYPKDSLDELKNAGIEHFIHIRSNLLQELQTFQKIMGVKS